MPQENPIITFSKLCPAIKLINNRTPKLIGFAIYDINSIGTSNKAKKNASKNSNSTMNLSNLNFSNANQNNNLNQGNNFDFKLMLTSLSEGWNSFIFVLSAINDSGYSFCSKPFKWEW